MLNLKNISFSYEKGKNVLEDISFEIKQGEIVAILGSSGSGKSTLLNIISGLEFAKSGKILLEENDITNIPCEKRNIGMVFQDYALFPHLSVAKNIAFSLKKYDEKIVDEMLELVRMKGYKKRYPHELSGGEKQRIAIARSLVAKPKVLLLDEPFSNLDYELKASLREELKEILKKSKTTVIIVTHDIEDAKTLAERIIRIKDGKVEKNNKNNRLFQGIVV